jgi:YidC/Oxa1 family membrane protein insertase
MGWLMKLLPFTTVVIAAVMPLAAGLYLLTTTAWAAAERMIIARRMPAAQASPGPAAAPGRRDIRTRSRSA